MPRCPVTGADECFCYLKTKTYYDVVKHHVDVHMAEHFTTPTEKWFETNEHHFKCVTESLPKIYDMKDVKKAHAACNSVPSTKFRD